MKERLRHEDEMVENNEVDIQRSLLWHYEHEDALFQGSTFGASVYS